MGGYLADDVGIYDAGDDLHGIAAGLAGFDIDAGMPENPTWWLLLNRGNLDNRPIAHCLSPCISRPQHNFYFRRQLEKGRVSL